MEWDYGPALLPRLSADHLQASDLPFSASEKPSKKASDRLKKHSHSHRKHDVEPRSACDQYTDESDQPWMSSSKKKHSDKSKHKARSRYVSFSSEEDQSDTGLQSPLGLSPLGLSLIKTNLNMTQPPLL